MSIWKMIRWGRMVVTATIASCAWTATPTFASPITIANHSFENVDVTGNTLGGQPPPGWAQADGGTVTSNATAYVIDKAHTIVSAPTPFPDGSDQTSMLRYDAILYQVLSTKIAPNTTYTLTIDAANRNNNIGVDGTLRLGVGSTVGTNLLTPDSTTTPTTSNGNWQTWQGTFTTGGSVADAFLRVEVYQFGIQGQDPQGLFDNVRLDASPVPEPTTLALLGAGGLVGLIGLARYRVRRRRARTAT